MNQIKLKRVVINNFKSFKHYEHDFNLEHEKISGHFGCGKSTIKKSLDFVLGIKVDDFRPCYFQDGFEWKELEAIDPTDVSWFIEVKDNNGIVSNYKLQVVADEKGTKYYVDDLKISTKAKYQEQLVNIFGVEDYETLLLITHLDNFLSLDWNKQREILKKLTNTDKELEKIKNLPQFKELKPYFDKGFGEIEIKKVLAKEKKDLESEKDKIIGAIREQELTVEKNSKVDYVSLEKELKNIENEIVSLSNVTIEKQLSDAKLSKQTNDLKIKELNSELALEEQYNNAIMRSKQSCNAIENELKEINEEIITIQNKQVVYDNVETECPYCHSIIKPKSHEEQEIDFEEHKLSQLTELNGRKKELEEELNEEKQALTAVEKEFEEYYKKNCVAWKEELKKLEEQNNLLLADIDYYSSLDNTNKITELNAKKNDIIAQLSVKRILEEAQARLQTLDTQRKAILEKIQKNILLENLRIDYSLSTMDVIENHINSYFSNDLHWKLFSKLITTGEFKEDLILISKGKRYDTACSNGERIVAKVNTVLGLQKILDINCFIFVDDFNDLGVEFNCSQQLILLETKQGKDLDNLERF